MIGVQPPISSTPSLLFLGVLTRINARRPSMAMATWNSHYFLSFSLIRAESSDSSQMRTDVAMVVLIVVEDLVSASELAATIKMDVLSRGWKEGVLDVVPLPCKMIHRNWTLASYNSSLSAHPSLFAGRDRRRKTERQMTLSSYASTRGRYHPLRDSTRTSW